MGEDQELYPLLTSPCTQGEELDWSPRAEVKNRIRHPAWQEEPDMGFPHRSEEPDMGPRTGGWGSLRKGGNRMGGVALCVASSRRSPPAGNE